MKGYLFPAGYLFPVVAAPPVGSPVGSPVGTPPVGSPVGSPPVGSPVGAPVGSPAPTVLRPVVSYLSMLYDANPNINSPEANSAQLNSGERFYLRLWLDWRSGASPANMRGTGTLNEFFTDAQWVGAYAYDASSDGLGVLSGNYGNNGTSGQTLGFHASPAPGTSDNPDNNFVLVWSVLAVNNTGVNALGTVNFATVDYDGGTSGAVSSSTGVSPSGVNARIGDAGFGSVGIDFGRDRPVGVPFTVNVTLSSLPSGYAPSVWQNVSAQFVATANCTVSVSGASVGDIPVGGSATVVLTVTPTSTGIATVDYAGVGFVNGQPGANTQPYPVTGSFNVV